MKPDPKAFFDRRCQRDPGTAARQYRPLGSLPVVVNRMDSCATGIGARSRLRSFLAGVALAMSVAHPALADPESERLELKALVDEGNLIQEEAAGLQPLTDRLAVEGAQLDAAEKTLREESAALDAAIAKFNATSAGLQRVAQELQAKCPRESEDKALVESCNAQVAELRTQVLKLDQERSALQRRQHDLNSAAEAHNSARREWTTRRGEHGARVQANAQDADYWVGQARRFLSSGAFPGLLQAAGGPAACEPAQLREIGSSAASAAVARVQACLKALDGPRR